MGTSTAEAKNGSAPIGEDDVVEDGRESDELQDSASNNSTAEVGVSITIPHQARHRHRRSNHSTSAEKLDFGESVEIENVRKVNWE